MTGDLKVGEMPSKWLNTEEYQDFKTRLSQNPNGDVREAFRKIVIMEDYITFLSVEFTQVMQDYMLEVKRSNELHKQLKNTIKLIRKK